MSILVNKDSKIVVIAGTTSVQVLPEYGPTCIVRRMWTTYSKALSSHLANKGIYINVLSPGVVLTDFHKKKIKKKAIDNNISYEEQMKKETENLPLSRYIKPIEVAQSIRFLLSSESDAIIGVNLILDGGTTVSY
jgi:NAD(P)-dependent dehydrogenase (short-subunit alcohol dehydrogenase family)